MTRVILTILGFGIAGLVIAVVTGWRALDLLYRVTTDGDAATATHPVSEEK